MSPLDPSTFGSRTPRTLDGREYPDHLRAYEDFDDQLLPILASMKAATFDELALEVDEPRVRAMLPRWLASAEWRGLVRRIDTGMQAPRRYGLGPVGRDIVDHVA